MFMFRCVQKTQLNCTAAKPASLINSSTSCLSLYHFRGHRKGGYYFMLHVIAGYGMTRSFLQRFHRE
jgi:hypothetical protein